MQDRTYPTLTEATRIWARIGLLSFGGPAGQIALMHRILVEEQRWLGEKRFLHALNYCMLLPGPEAMQLAVYIGWLMHRTLGGIIAGVLFVLPGVIAIMALSWIYALYGNVGPIEALFFGLKAAVLAIVVQAVIRIGSRALKNGGEWAKLGGVCVCWWFIEKGTAMEVRIIVETTFENGTTKRHRLGRLSRPFRRTQPEGFGLLLEDAKTILGQLQSAILHDQIEEISEASRICPDCDGVRAIHDYRSRVLDTLFGRFEVKAPRIRRCACNAKSDVVLGGPLSPLAHFFPDRSTPELRRLQAELGARHSFREAVRILETFLPCAKQVNTSVRNRLGKVAREICDSEQNEPLVPSAAEEAPALTVFLDGAHIRCRPEYQKRHLDVVVGKIEGHDRCRRFGLVQQAVLSPASQLRQHLRALGWDHEQTVTVISDGEPALPNLVRNAVDGKVRHILDWWHISMRIQHVENAVKGLLQSRGFSGIPVLFKRPAETLRWYLWHGKVLTATTSLQWLIVDCTRLNTDDRMAAEAARRVQARCRDLYSYLASNMDSLTDYGRRYRTGFPISSSRAEGCVDDIGNTRMGKRRRMRWSPNGAHRVAVVRAAVLDGRLTGAYQRAAA